MGNIIEEIKHAGGLSKNTILFLFLHIDEFQVIFDWETNWKKDSDNNENSSGFFKQMTYVLGKYMANTNGDLENTFMQTFLSGTAQHSVICSKEPTMYHFELLYCPTLSWDAIREIVDYFFRENLQLEKDN